MKKSAIAIKLGKHIRKIRLKKDISQERLGQLAELHRTYIGMIERGEKNLSITSIEKIAKALKVPIVDLFDF